MAYRWTPEQEVLAKELFARRASDREFWEKLGRTKMACYMHVLYVKKTSNTKCPQKLKTDERLDKNDTVGGPTVLSFARPTEEMLEEAQKRSLLPRTLTAILCGDPAPGFSQLDKKQQKGELV